MKRIKVKRTFLIQVTPERVKRIAPGTYRIPEDIDSQTADKIVKFGKAELFIEKKAPENKLGTVAENKASLEGSAGDSGSTGSKPNARRTRGRKKVRVEDAGSTG